MIKITCSNCGKQLSIDETKLPMKEVKFPCPQCKADQFYDRSKAGAEAPAAAAAAPVVETDDDLVDPAMLVGKEVPGIREAVQELGFKLKVFAGGEEARDFYYQEYPHLVFFSPSAMTQPPLQEMAAMTSVSPVDRRKGFFVLVADNLRTLDGNAAFLYNVNLIVATKDLPQFKKIYRDAHRFHDKLYQHILSLSED